MRTILFSITVLVFASAAAFADSITVTLDTTSLITNTSGPYTLDFQFIDGSATGDANNTVTLSNFLVTPPGSVSSPSSTTGGVTTSSSPFSITLTDSSFFNEAQMPYAPGASLTFEANYTTNVDDPTPDSFTLAILDGNGDEISTSNSNSNDSFLEVDLPTSTSGTVIMSSGSSDGSIPAPVVVPGGLPTAPTIPEPATFLLTGIAGSALLLWRRRFRA